MILHDYTVIIAKQTPIKHGFKYELAEFKPKEASTDELNKLYLEADSIMANILIEIDERENHGKIN